MAEGTQSSGSVSITNSDCKNDKIEKNISTSAFLFNNEGNFAWKGDLPTLKVFVDGIIKHLKCKDGKWSSPREEEKLFKCAKFTLKWFGKKKEKLVIVKDNEENSLQNTLETCAQTKGVENQQATSKHVADAIDIESQQQNSQLSDSNLPASAVSPVYENCSDYEHQIANILTLLAEINTKQQEDSQQNISVLTKCENTISDLSEQNIKMAAEIDSLKSTVTELSFENKSIKYVLDMKQSEWAEVKQTKSKKETKTTSSNGTGSLISNPYAVLEVEDVPDVEELITSKVAKRKSGQTKDPLISSDSSKSTSSKSKATAGSAPNKVKKSNHEKTVLVIGDSMVRNIDACKIGRASRSKAISHSYSGATVNQLTEKFGNHQSEQEFSTVIIHVGTNDLVRDEPKKVAANLENLINKVKVHTEKIAVSGTIKRYDGKLNNKKIEQYNNLVNGLCSKHKITFIDNSCIDKPLLNRSKLHLNREGDKALGGAFCTYLKSDRIGNTNMASSRNDSHFFRQSHGHQKDWTMYLAHVKQVMKQKAD